MSQDDLVIANQTFPATRTDLNSNFAALGSLMSGASAPSTTYAYMWWADTTNGVLKQRNSSDNAWVIRATLSDDRVVTKTTSYTVVAGDYDKLILCSASGGAFTVTLTAAATLGDGFRVRLKKTDSTANAVTLDGNASETIDGVVTLSLPKQYDEVELVCDGANWFSFPGGLAVRRTGDVMSGDIGLVSTNTGQVAGFRNGLVNGAFDVWQAGTSFSPTASTLTFIADMWSSYRTTSANHVISQQTGPDGSRYCTRVLRNNTTTETHDIQYAQSLETLHSHRYRGKKATIRFKARCGATYSAASSLLAVAVKTGTGTDERIITGYTGSTSDISSSVTLTTSWQTFSLTSAAVLSASITEVGVLFTFTPVGTAGATDYYEIAEVELVEGEVASTYFERLTYDTILQSCFRQLPSVISTGTSATIGSAFATSTTTAFVIIPLKTRARGAITGITVSNVAHVTLSDGTTPTASTNVTFLAASADAVVIQVTVASGLTQFRPYVAYFNNASASILFTGARI